MARQECDYFEEEKKWKLLGHFSAGTASHNLPAESEFDELLIMARMSTGGALDMSIHIPKIALTIYEYSWRTGYYFSSSGYAGVAFIVTKTTIRLSSAYLNGSSIISDTSNMAYSVYYK